jgi:hypothetical protein
MKDKKLKKVGLVFIKKRSGEYKDQFKTRNVSWGKNGDAG